MDSSEPRGRGRARSVGARVLVLALVLAGIVAQPAWAIREVSPSGSDAGNDCTTQEDPCATIQHAVDEAEEHDWVSVGPGTYAENVTIDKPLTLTGPRSVLSSDRSPAAIDGGSGTAITVESHDVSIEGMTVTAGTSGTAIRSTSGANVNRLRVQENIISGGSTGMLLEADGDEDWIDFNLIEGVGDGIHLSGSSYSDLIVSGNHVVAPIGGYAVLADSGATIKGLRFEFNKMAAPIKLAARMVRGGMWGNWVIRNSFDSMNGPQLAFDGEDVTVDENSFDGHGTAGCLQILGNQGGLTPSNNIQVYGQNEFVDCAPYGVELGPEVDEVSVYGNEFPGSYDGVVASDASPWDVTGHAFVVWNRFVGTTHLGVVNAASGTLDAEQNWWGCNAGPGAVGCDGVSAGVDALNNVRLVGLIGPRKPESGIIELPTATSITLNPGEQAEVAAMLTVDGSRAILDVPTEKFEVGFSSSLGTLSSATNRLFNGWTKSIFTAGTKPGHGWISVSMDNQQTLVPVTIPGESSEEEPTTASPGTTTNDPSSTPAPAPPAPKVETPQAPTFKLSGKHDRLAGHEATVGSVSCSDSCRLVTGQVLILIGRHRYRGTARPSGTLPAGSTTPIRIALPSSAMRALKRGGSARIRVVVTVTDAAGQATRRTIAVSVGG
jgi:Periplasmic copper-binding protein (NosD)